TGKSLAYLIPAVYWARATGEKVVVSTNTINLQEQLIFKDIPFLQQWLGIDFKAVLVKGRANYVCRRKLQMALSETLDLFDPQEAVELARLAGWAEDARTGCRSELEQEPSFQLWERVCAESETCLRNDCPFFADCFVTKARKEALEADILVVNHHLFFADVAVRRALGVDAEVAVLPRYRYVIFDEAHNVENVATEYFGCSVSRYQIGQLMGRLLRKGVRQAAPSSTAAVSVGAAGGSREGAAGRAATAGKREHFRATGLLPGIRAKIRQCDLETADTEALTSLETRLTQRIPDALRLVDEANNAFFAAAGRFAVGEVEAAETRLPGLEVGPGASRYGDSAEIRLRIRDFHRRLPGWTEDLAPAAEQLLIALRALDGQLESLAAELGSLGAEPAEGWAAFLIELSAVRGRVAAAIQAIDYIVDGTDPGSVYWVEFRAGQPAETTRLQAAPIRIADEFLAQIVLPAKSVVLTSATLTVGQSFAYLKSRLGMDQLDSDQMVEAVYQSPFHYRDQVLIGIPMDLPDPRSETFEEAAAQAIGRILVASRGRAFVLFTSYAAMQKVYRKVTAQLAADPIWREHGWPIFKQGDAPRHQLISRFRDQVHSVLFATDSFWEGVDVPGEALSCVILVKLPFRVPTEPVVEARVEEMERAGRNSFAEYMLPQAVLKFKQGFGRLIRSSEDCGSVVILDRRVLQKSYGQVFLDSLPECSRVCGDLGEICERIGRWLK
ncbi:MAG: ATP-dependent DNA helicase, partial [Syntrophothermus sp.]